MKAAVYIDSHRIEARETKPPELLPGDILLRVTACGVCGTDVRKVRHDLVRSPSILGHEVAGVVEDVGSNVSKFALGDRVVVAHHTPCWVCHYCRHENFSMCRKFKASNLDPGGFAELVRVPAAHVEMTAHKIPSHLTDEQAIFMEPLACVLRNLKRTTVLPGDHVLIIGLGSMGLLTGQMIQHLGANVMATDLKESRRKLGQDLGFQAVWDGSDIDLEEKVLTLTEGRGADLVVLTAGDAALYSEAVQYLRDGGSLNIFAGLPPDSPLQIDVNEIYSREITIFSSYSPSPVELQEALEYLQQGVVNVDILQPKNYSLEDTASAIDDVMNQDVLKAVIRPQGVSL